MSNLKTPSYKILCAFWFLFLMQSQVFCYQYKVGDLDSWGIPTSADPQLYTKWSKFHTLRLGDSLLFLYPPSQDSVIQVTEEYFKTCNLKDPILYMDNGNSLFNITSSGEFYFTSGKPGHCEKKQKLHISVPGNGSAFSPSYGPSALPDSAAGPSYPTVFGSIPQPPSSSSSSSPYQRVSVFMTAIIGSAICVVIKGIM
ncbi:Stellacyanin putative isoform 1 [Tripterygium wilfordii]|uniref:Stellacyanin putative isoform 1 n=1 Tax=Tripterygium wilfordii TaxID=458696 RepID=A0A7J7CLN6_TRIWF|nr:mavicyanin-like [Tripterygium wilfordii]KAF5734964.1 Stellacyanin putative isoform 1 [Tripterygium wilfordii]